MNAFRQGKALGTYLIVGVNSDETITQCKGKPVTNDEERVEMVKGCKWVDEVVEGVPYIMSDEYLAYVIQKYQIDYVVHGDDPCIVDGKDVYESAQKMGKYLTIPRTEGISTTDIVGRIKSNFLTTSRIIRLFSTNVKAPTNDDKVVYLAGSWDMFHAGHVHILQQARHYGTYVVVGVHSDIVVNAKQGFNYPILNLHERVLSVLGCKYVDDVLIDAPYEITNELLAALKDDEMDPYLIPKQLGIFKVVKSIKKLTVNEIVSRIQSQHDRYSQKYNKKKLQEDEYYNNKYSNQKI
eukprot:gene19277-25134_t